MHVWATTKRREEQSSCSKTTTKYFSWKIFVEMQHQNGKNSILLLYMIIVAQISKSGCFREQLSCSNAIGPDEDSIVTLQSCSETGLEVWYSLNEYIDYPTLIIELDCTDDTQRSFTKHGIPITGTSSFILDPPLPESGLGSECSVSICYEEGYFYQIYAVPNSPQTLSFQQDCKPPPPPSLAPSRIPNYIDEAELVSSDDVGILLEAMTTTGMKPVLTSVVVLYSETLKTSAIESTTTTQTNIYSPTTTIITYSRSLPTSVDATTTITTLHSTSSIPVPVPERTSSTFTSRSTSSIIVHTTSTGVSNVFIPSSSTTNNSSISVTLPIDSNIALSPTLIFTVSLLVFVTVVVVIVASLLCVVQLITQYHKRVRQDIQDIPPVEVENKQKYTYSHQVSHSPSICTIVSPLSPINITEDSSEYSIFSFDSSPTTRRPGHHYHQEAKGYSGYRNDSSTSSGVYSHNTSEDATVSRETSNCTINFTAAKNTDEICYTADSTRLTSTSSSCDESANYSYGSISLVDEDSNTASSESATITKEMDGEEDGSEHKTNTEDSYIRTILRNSTSTHDNC